MKHLFVISIDRLRDSVARLRDSIAMSRDSIAKPWDSIARGLGGGLGHTPSGFARGSILRRSPLVFLGIAADLVLNRARGRHAGIGPHLIGGQMHRGRVDGNLGLDIVPYDFCGIGLRGLVLFPGAERVGNHQALQVRLNVDHVSFGDADFVAADQAQNMPLRFGAYVFCDEEGVVLRVVLLLPGSGFDGPVGFLEGTHSYLEGA